MSVISDKPLMLVDEDNSNEFLGYEADILQFGEYYPFGMKMPGELAKNGDYRFGYNGMEQDDEVSGDGNSIDFGARMYDPRTGRMKSVDLMSSMLPSHSPYHYALNNPIALVDEEGKFPKASEIFADLGIDLPPLAAGILDGAVENFGIVSLASLGKTTADIAFDGQSRQALINGLYSLASDPIGTLTSIGEEYIALAERIISGEATDKDWYDAGYNAGSLFSGGTSVKKFLKDLVTFGRKKDLLIAGINKTELDKIRVKQAKGETLTPAEQKAFEDWEDANPKRGRLGNPRTRRQLSKIADMLEDNGWTVTNGAKRGKEEYFPGPGGTSKDGSYVDLTAKKDGKQ